MMNGTLAVRRAAVWLRYGLRSLGLALLVAILALAALITRDSHRIRQFDKTVDHELQLSVDDPYTLALFSELDPVFASESLRIVGNRFRGADFALALSLDPQPMAKDAVGQIVIANRGTISKRDLRIPATAVRQLFSEWDRQIADYPGSPYTVLDGNPLAFDRRSGRRTQSGAGNGCHYDELGNLLARRLGPFVPELNAWRITPTEWADRQPACAPSIWGRMWHRLLS